MMPGELSHLLASVSSNITGGIGDNSSGTTSERLVTLMTEIRCFQEILSKFKEMQVDPTEYACLKAIVLFKTGKWPFFNGAIYKSSRKLTTKSNKSYH